MAVLFQRNGYSSRTKQHTQNYTWFQEEPFCQQLVYFITGQQHNSTPAAGPTPDLVLEIQVLLRPDTSVADLELKRYKLA